MSNRYEYPQVSVVGEVTNELAQLVLLTDTSTTMHLHIEQLAVSVYEPATGGGGKFRLQDENGDVIWTTNADGVKDLTLDFGEEGLKRESVNLQAVVYGAGTKQASVSVLVKGHLQFRS